MKYLHLLFCSSLFLMQLLFYKNEVIAQCKWVKLNIDGLTCSQCSYNVDQSINRLDFIKNVTTDLNTHESYLEFIEGKKVNLKKIALQVEKAGYSLRSFQFYYQTDSLINIPNLDLSQLVLLSEQNENSFFETGIYRLLERKFNDKKNYQLWEKKIKKHQEINSKSKNFVYVVKEG
ncbi:MAG: copper chaperone [Cytophagales bacterium]|nr:MAG: copper chaperone [Cytophagales bacterium]